MSETGLHLPSILALISLVDQAGHFSTHATGYKLIKTEKWRKRKKMGINGFELKKKKQLLGGENQDPAEQVLFNA